METKRISKTCGIDRNSLTAAGVVRPTTTLDSLRLDARHSTLCQVAQYAGEPGRWIVVTPSGSAMGTSLTPMGCADAEELAGQLVQQGRAAGYFVRLDEVSK